MSFYFNIATDKTVTADQILEALGRPEVSVDDNKMIFHIPGKSLRGACVYHSDEGYEVGVNAFTPKTDARLTRDVAAAIAWLTGASVVPEDSEDSFSPEYIADYGGEDWVAERFDEAYFLARRPDDAAEGGPLSVAGYKRTFAVTPDMFEQDAGSLEDAIRAVMQVGIDLQTLDDREDIFAASLMSFTPPAAPPQSTLRRMFGLSKPVSNVREPYTAFFIGPDVRTLTPYNETSDPFYVHLSVDQKAVFRLPADDFFAYAEAAGARAYGAQVYDITISQADHAKLMQQAEPA
ncbi:hypothetical protein [Tropicibacter sp. S64]|uniref:hypothetical protein n=1 Tax=Tropicibacter sp. S64 TaxID=3415122 RepID=UPI003C7A478D